MPIAGNILWLTGKRKLSGGYKFVLDALLKKENLALSQVYFCSIREKTVHMGEMHNDEIELIVDDFIRMIKPKFIVCSDEETLHLFTKGTLFFCRGSIYEYKSFNVLVIDHEDRWVNTTITVRGKSRAVPGRWLLINDIQKLSRWMHGKQRKQPQFEYLVCETHGDLVDALRFLTVCELIAIDIETHPGRITIVGFTGLHPSGKVFTYVIPFFNPFKKDFCHWPTDESEEIAWDVVRKICSCPAVKTLQNGGYDAQYFFKYRIALYNWSLDTMHLFHSIYTEAPKKLNLISSILLDYCRFWKDESKGDGDEGAEHKGKFKSKQAYDRYVRYNALDCYNTLLNTRVLVYLISKLPWALENYKIEFMGQVGPANEGSMHGFLVSTQRIAAKRITLEDKSNLRLKELRIMADDPEFNPGSPQQFGHFLYQTLGAKKPILKGKNKSLGEYTVSEPVLKIIRNDPTQSLQPLFEMIIDKVLDYKKPKNNISKYCNMIISNHNRFMYSLSAAGTETGRYASRKSNFAIGNQAQNVPLKIRDICVADPGYVFFEPDFSQSDLWFVAHASGDQSLINNLLSGKDMHCVHGAFFFKMDYEDFYKRYKEGDPIIADEPTGLRYITKRIVHGKNYNMAGFTLYLLMGRAAVVAAAKALSHQDAGNWGIPKLTHFCQVLLNSYDKMYPRVAKYQEELLMQAVKNGNKIEASGGRTRLFFGDLAKDKAVQREAIAYVGQGGTAGKTNKVLLKLYYDTPEIASAIFITQTHDSLLYLVPENDLHPIANKMLTTMAEPVTLNGRTFVVPTAAKVGYSWGPGPLEKEFPLVMKYSKNIDLSILRYNEQKVYEFYNEVLVSRGKKEIETVLTDINF